MIANPTRTSIKEVMQTRGFCYFEKADFDRYVELESAFKSFANSWNDLAPDVYIGEGYRFRRYDVFRVNPLLEELTLLPHAAYVQPGAYNQLVGDEPRDYAPVSTEITENPFLHYLILFSFRQMGLTEEQKRRPWDAEVHQIRTVTSAKQIGQPSPEGPHQEGGQYVGLYLLQRSNVVGGYTQVFDLDGTLLGGREFDRPLDSVLIKDDAFKHHGTPIWPKDPQQIGTRDILTLDCYMR